MGYLEVLVKVFEFFGGEAVSEALDVPKEKIKGIFRNNDLNKLMEVYHVQFREAHDYRIAADNVNMQRLYDMRKDILKISRKYLEKQDVSINFDSRGRYIKEVTELLGMSSNNTIDRYLDGVYYLVFMNETEESSDAEKALVNKLAGQIHDELKTIEIRVGNVESRVDKLEKPSQKPTDFSAYYEYVVDEFYRKKSVKDEGFELTGEYSDDEAYIEAYISDRRRRGIIRAQNYLEKWFDENKFDAILIYGEPGHGKTTLCRKAMVDFYKGRFLKNKAKNVLAFSLNTGKHPGIVNERELKLNKALSWGEDDDEKCTFKDCSGSLLFLDGFDEFIDAAKEVNVANIVDFMKKVFDIAKKYYIHIVVLSRTIAVQLDLNNLKFRYFSLHPITDTQQIEWFDKHQEYKDYIETYKAIRQNNDMRILLGIPFLFRLIVQSRFDQISTNVVELYDKLVDHLLEKRQIYRDDREQILSSLRNLAYDIYCTDTYDAVINKDEKEKGWILSFYIKQEDNGRIAFYHRSFYQYFLAKYIYNKLLDVKNEKEAEDFVSLFAERELDITIRQYLALMHNERDLERLYEILGYVVDVLVRTQGIISFEPKFLYGNAEKTRMGRATNVFRNVFHLCAAFEYVIKIPFKENLDLLFRAFPSDGITICSNEAETANLRGVKLNGLNLANVDMRFADLSYASLRGADLTHADLRGANLCKAFLSDVNLCEAFLSGANLSGADLSGARLSRANLHRAYLLGADLSLADLSLADLIRANLGGTNLIGAYLREVDLLGADLSKAKLLGADLSRAELIGCKLRETNMIGAFLIGANLIGADLTDARIDIHQKDLIDNDIMGYKTIQWWSNEELMRFLRKMDHLMNT